MKELVKPNLGTQELNIVQPECDSQDTSCYRFKCNCWSAGNDVIDENEDILF